MEQPLKPHLDTSLPLSLYYQMFRLSICLLFVLLVNLVFRWFLSFLFFYFSERKWERALPEANEVSGLIGNKFYSVLFICPTESQNFSSSKLFRIVEERIICDSDCSRYFHLYVGKPLELMNWSRRGR
jgi:hypothetical protein